MIPLTPGALADAAGNFYAGTLGGLAEISSGRVVRVFKDSNSALACNWVTAVRGAPPLLGWPRQSVSAEPGAIT